MPESAAPPSSGVAALLRTAVFAHATSERRRIFGAILHVGLPGHDHVTVPATPRDDHDQAVRTDIVAAMLTVHRRSGLDAPPVAWLTRPGELTLHDADAAWLGPVAAAAREAGATVTFAVVTKRGWWDPRSGVRRVWKRPRTR